MRHIAAVGPLPPPLNGMSVMTQFALLALGSESVPVAHIDISDHRQIGNVGRFDLENVVLAFRHAHRAQAIISEYKPALVYMPVAQGTLGFLRDSLILAATRRAGVPVVLHFHGAEFGVFYKKANWFIRRLAEWCFEGVVGAIVLTDYAKHDIESVRRWRQIHVVPNGIPEAPAPGTLDIANPHVRVLYVSKLSERKGILDLLQAVPRIVAAVPDVRFVFAGGGGRVDSARASRMVEQLGLARLVEFHGEVEEVEKLALYNTTDIFVFPPRRPEGQGLVVLEAMRASLPVVATRIGSMSEMVEHGTSGLLVGPGSPDELADAIILLCRDVGLRRRMGQNGREIFDARFTYEHFRRSLVAAVSCHLPSRSESAGARA
jgi:glycosyltransferase involved in cell wall biosynthesis